MLQLTTKFILIVVIMTISYKLIESKRKGNKFINSPKFKTYIYLTIASILFIVRLIWVYQTVIDETWGKFLFTELSNFSAMIMMFGLFVRKDSIVKLMLPWFLIAGALPLLFNRVWSSENFTGTLFSYIGHSLMYFASMGLILTVSKFSRKDFINAFMMIIYFLTYVFIVSGIPYLITGNVHFGIFATGMFPPSYVSQQVGNTIINHYVFLKDFGPYPIGTLVFYSLATIAFGIGIWFIKKVQAYIELKEKPKINILEKMKK